ncbi:MAG: Wzz/FepE/Etk N-terminal domain-containing protein [bacterium]
MFTRLRGLLLPQPKPIDTSSEDADVLLFLGALWTHRGMLLSVGALFAVLGLVLALLLSPQYRGRTTFLLSDSDSAGSAVSSLANRFGSLASLAGISVGGQGGQSARALALLKSNRFAVRFMRKHALDRELFPERWNAAAKRWNPGAAPSDSELSEEWFDGIFSLSEDQKSGQISVSIVWPGDPEKAAELANQFVKEADDWLRAQTIKRTEEHLAYLSAQLAASPTQGIREAITQVMESEIERRMFANGTGHYLIEIIDPAIAEHEPVFPSPPIFLAGFGTLGFILAAIVALIRTHVLLRRAAKVNVVPVRRGIAKSA